MFLELRSPLLLSLGLAPVILRISPVGDPVCDIGAFESSARYVPRPKLNVSQRIYVTRH